LPHTITISNSIFSYIEVLKNELAQALAKISAAKDSAGTDSKPSSTGQHSQTILALRRVIEKLKIENKLLRDGKKSPSAGSSSPADAQEAFNELKAEHEKCKQQLIEALDEISAIKIELELQQSTAVCSTCHKGDESLSPDLEGDKDVSAHHLRCYLVTNFSNFQDEYQMKSIRERLAQKTQLLEKAKLLLTRAAAKEKNLKEQIKFLRRRCSELQNIPIIDECSE
jgi:centrosomal protein CEP290